jgi:hypothetical protein
MWLARVNLSGPTGSNHRGSSCYAIKTAWVRTARIGIIANVFLALGRGGRAGVCKVPRVYLDVTSRPGLVRMDAAGKGVHGCPR